MIRRLKQCQHFRYEITHIMHEQDKIMKKGNENPLAKH